MKRLAWALASLLAASAWADEPGLSRFSGDLTWASKYMTDGFKVGGDDPVLQPSVSAALVGGLSAMFWSAIRTNRSQKQYDELDFFLKYSHDFFTGAPFAFRLHAFYDYWLYPSTQPVANSVGEPVDVGMRRGNKFHLGGSLVGFAPVAEWHLVPSYNVYYWAYWADNRTDLYQGGARHELLLEAFRSLPRFIPGSQAQYVGVSGSTSYNDGAFGVHPAWSHATAQVSTSVYTAGGVFALSVNRQWSLEPTVDPTNELWSTLSFTRGI
jgi:hypothetical protein